MTSAATVKPGFASVSAGESGLLAGPLADVHVPAWPTETSVLAPGPDEPVPVTAGEDVVPDTASDDDAVTGSTAGPADLAGDRAEAEVPSTSAGRLDRGAPDGAGSPERGACTPAQLRRFIKSRAYIPMHEIRRRFSIVTEDDDVIGVDLQETRIYLGLPAREGQMLGDLLRAGEVGFELQLDPCTPVVVGVYPMRPVSRT